jgi:hypothetical protein
MRAMDVMTTNVITVSPDTTGYSDRPIELQGGASEK